MENFKLRKCLSLLLAAVLCLAMLPFAASAESSGDFEYEVLEAGTAEITAYTGSGGDVEIPAEIDGYSVTSIGSWAFYGCTSLENVSIGSGVTSIGSGAFYDCKSLVSITIPDSVTSIESYAFYDCKSLASVTIPDGVTSIGSSTFEECSSLTSITIPDSVTSIGSGAFEDCTTLTEINVAEENGAYSSIDGVLFNKDGTTLIAYPAGKGQTYVIPDSVTSIGSQAFYGCSSLESITIPDSVTSIEWNAFDHCSNLESVSIGSGVISIGENAFEDCSSLTAVFYCGDEASWEEIAIEYGNNPLVNACRIYISSDEEIYTAESVSVIAPASVLEESAVFKAEPVSAEDLSIADTQEYDLNNALIYDIYFEKDEQRVQPDGTVTVYIPVPETLVAETCQVIYIDDEGNLTDMNAVCENGVMVFTTDHFSLYALVGESTESEYTPGDVNSDGKVDSVDATLVLQFYANIINENTAGYNNSAADLNGDGDVTAADATVILQIYAGIN